MPYYEYTCTACGKAAEILHKISDPPATDCPACGKPALTKQISAAGFRLKGAGWYETDFKSGGKKNLAGDSGASGASGKSESASAPAASTSSSSGGGSTAA